MFYGRSGLVLTIISSIIGFLVWQKNQGKKILRVIALLAIGIALLFRVKDAPSIYQWYIWMSSPIKNILTTGRFNNVSFNTTFYEMIFVPEIKTIIFGDGKYVENGHYYMQTDSGLMRNILFWGILGVLVSYGVTICSIFELKKTNGFLTLLVIVCFIVFELKGAVYYEFIALMSGISFADVVKRKNYLEQ